MNDSYQPDSIDDLLEEKSKDTFKIHKQFKADFGMTLDEADNILVKMKSDSDELYHLRCLLNGVDTHNYEKPSLTDKEKELIAIRIEELTN
tara:strand:+ start:1651 stop:1923 length:273 start_codon:yes stop_codon:yes gene_type:complete